MPTTPTLSFSLLLARIILCLAFVPAGMRQLQAIEFSGPEATQVAELTGAATTPNAEGIVTVSARRLYAQAIEFYQANWPSPVVFAWIAAVLQLAGGGFLLVGFLSRLWSFGLLVLLGITLSFILVPALCAGPAAVFWDMDHAAPKTVSHLALLGLAVLVTLSGPGVCSLDRLLGGRPKARIEHAKNSG